MLTFPEGNEFFQKFCKTIQPMADGLEGRPRTLGTNPIMQGKYNTIRHDFRLFSYMRYKLWNELTNHITENTNY